MLCLCFANLFYFGNKTLRQGICLGHALGLGVDADDGLGVRLAKVYPVLGKVYLYAVNIVDLFV